MRFEVLLTEDANRDLEDSESGSRVRLTVLTRYPFSTPSLS
jgi:hypothetical protein